MHVWKDTLQREWQLLDTPLICGDMETKASERSPRSGLEEHTVSPSSITFKFSSMVLIKSHTWSFLERWKSIHISLTGWSRNSALAEAFTNCKVTWRCHYPKLDFIAMNKRVVINMAIPVNLVCTYISARSIRQGHCPQELKVQLRRWNLYTLSRFAQLNPWENQ